MNSRFFLLAFATALLIGSRLVADEAPKKQASEEEIKARLAEHARKHASHSLEAPTKAAPAPATDAGAGATTKPGATTPAKDAKTEAPAKPGEPAAAAAKADEPPSVLPKVDVRKNRVTELDRQLEKQNAEIAREKEKTKPTKLDDTLNGKKISSALAIFGGQSGEDRANIAKERVAMMEEERDMLEAIAQAPTKEEKAELQKTLDAMRAMRRDLETALR